MKPYELNIICDSLHLRTKDNWEQSRLIAFVMAQANSKRKLKPTDIVKFAWEKEKEKKEAARITSEDMEEIKKVALLREKKLKEIGII